MRFRTEVECRWQVGEERLAEEWPQRSGPTAFSGRSACGGPNTEVKNFRPWGFEA
jgi:hypothetical protein